MLYHSKNGLGSPWFLYKYWHYYYWLTTHEYLNSKSKYGFISLVTDPTWVVGACAIYIDNGFVKINKSSQYKLVSCLTDLKVGVHHMVKVNTENWSKDNHLSGNLNLNFNGNNFQVKINLMLLFKTK